MNSIIKPRFWHLAHDCTLKLDAKAIVMGILNVTPDSFSDGGKYFDINASVEHALRMIGEGATIIDIGGESTRPGSNPTTAQEEQDRVLPVVELLKENTNTFLSIDTYRATTAELALKAGAHIINDVWGFQKDTDIASVAKQYNAGCCAMHTGREREKENNVIKDQFVFFEKSLNHLKEQGIKDSQIMLDPGFGFGKDEEECIQILSHLEELHSLGYPLLVGTSRKRFIGHFTRQNTENRDIGTTATSVVARMKGAQVFRVHDVASNVQALAIADAVIAAKQD